MSIPGSGNQDQNWASRARTAVMALAKSGRKFTSYDVSLAGGWTATPTGSSCAARRTPNGHTTP